MADSKKKAETETEAVAEEVAKAIGQDKGFIGTQVDETPNEDYTVAGVTKESK